MTKKPHKKPKPILKLIFWVTTVVAVAVAIAIVVYGGYLAKRIENRFSGRRWNIPSTVYSDTTLLYPGQKVNRPFFSEKLHRLGYREVSRALQRSGQVLFSHRHIDIFLHDFKSPTFEQIGFAVRIRFKNDHITSIVRLKDNQSIPILTLEPEELMRFYGPDRERRRLISIDKVPPHLIHAVLAAEDRDFYSHHGVDLTGILRALITNLRTGAIRQGGSTLTQQLAKNYFLTPERTYTRKLREVLISLVLEIKYGKDEILEIYLNEIYWGQGGSVSINGVGEAALFYFGKPVEALSIAEAATLAGLIKGPNAYSPYRNKSRCLKRRNEILVTMHQNGWLENAALKDARARALQPAGQTAYHRQAPYFIDYLTHQMADLYPPNVLSSLGLSIFTTLDTQVQLAAEQALEKGLSRLEVSHPALKRKDPGQKLQGAIIVIQPKTGYILAMVGGREYGISQFNRATQARRQPGSAFKPFVYVTALNAFTPVDQLDNTPKPYTVDENIWRPKNYSLDAPGRVTLRQALAHSHNIATINLGIETGLESIVKTAIAFGLTTDVKPLPSLSLGAFEVIPLELARAYCVFAADGMLPFPLSMKEIMDDNGKVLERRHANVKQLISPAKAFIMNDLLLSVTTQGTAAAIKTRGINWPVAGKTGTTNNARDAWFVGYTPDILALVWVGFDNSDTTFSNGSRAALPIWVELMNAIPQYVSGEWFTMPPGVVEQTVCVDSSKLAVQNSCPHIVTEVFLEETGPQERCPLHGRFAPFKNLLKGVKKLFRHE